MDREGYGITCIKMVLWVSCCFCPLRLFWFGFGFGLGSGQAWEGIEITPDMCNLYVYNSCIYHSFLSETVYYG